MEYSDILIYIIVISVVFISTVAKKRGETSKQVDKKPTQANNTPNENLTQVKPLADRYNWNDNSNRIKIDTEDNIFEETPKPATNTSLPLNSAEELRQAVIVSEILKRKF